MHSKTVEVHEDMQIISPNVSLKVLISVSVSIMTLVCSLFSGKDVSNFYLLSPLFMFTH